MKFRVLQRCSLFRWNFRQYDPAPERDFFIDSLLVRIHLIIVMIWWTGLAPWEFVFPFPGRLVSAFLVPQRCHCYPLRGRGPGGGDEGGGDAAEGVETPCKGEGRALQLVPLELPPVRPCHTVAYRDTSLTRQRTPLGPYRSLCLGS